MKKLLSALLAACIAFSALPAIAASAEETQTAAEFSMDDLAAGCDCIIYCFYKGRSGDSYKFETIRMIKGSIDETYFYVDASEDFGKDLLKDEKYVLFLDKKISVYYPQDMYSPVLDIKVCADEKGNITAMTILGKPAENLPATVSILTKYLSSVESTAVPDKDYIRSTDVSDIISGSGIIAKVIIADRISDYIDGSGVYSCILVSAEKGSIPSVFSAALFDADVTEGATYYILLNSDPIGGIYTLSSKNSIYLDSDEGFEEAIK